MNPTQQHALITAQPVALRACGTDLRVIPGASSQLRTTTVLVQDQGLYGRNLGHIAFAKPANWTFAHPDARGLIGS